MERTGIEQPPSPGGSGQAERGNIVASISSYKIDTDVVVCNYDDMCFGLMRIVRGDGVTCMSVRGKERPIHERAQALADAKALSVSSDVNAFFDVLYE